MRWITAVVSAGLLLAGCGGGSAAPGAEPAGGRQDLSAGGSHDRAAPKGPGDSSQSTGSAQSQDGTASATGGGVATEGTADPANPWSGTSAPDAAFLMPSTNVACGIGPEWVACQIADRDYTPSHTFPGCRATEADTLLLRAGQQAQWVCSEHSMFGVRHEVQGATLSYGSVMMRHGFTCLSDTDGVQCSEDSTGYSFRLARSSYDLS
ncbi:hypothetical protein FNH13_01915 [Ornithinimicrobium ciconiae]|uniref:Lipoprotein n=1 Tax=Ornithinimicrobium ciconiae TaxID=2594265 RepID=A0A516G6S0_9MICO|nr:hypothetical protein [Ornithinimicrobium ciconiae]QDO87237.1 hypothetical protein FNH13_01915 [Ornithinimicrobium ciconiae]